MAKYILTDTYDEEERVRVFTSKDKLISHLIYNIIGDMKLEVEK